MANNAPTTGIHQGASGGNDSPSSRPVSSALPSESVGITGRLRNRSIVASASNAVAEAMSRLNRTPQPKNHSRAMAPGIRPSMTRTMSLDTELFNGRQGELCVGNSIRTGHRLNGGDRLQLCQPAAAR